MKKKCIKNERETKIAVVGTGMVGWHSDTVPWLSHRSYDRNNQVDVSLSSLLEQKRIPRVMIARSQGWCFNCDLSAERSLSRGRGIDGTVERGLSETALVNLIEWTSPPMAPW